MSRRDDFPESVKAILARRVGMRCSNPNCRKLTSGPQTDPAKAVNIGVAAHITAAAPGGSRYDPSLSTEERRSPENGIWLCQNCAKLVDNDELRYPVDLLRRWKRLSEEAARLEVEAPGITVSDSAGDIHLMRFYAQAFDRPAFQDPFREEGSMEAFDRAIEDTITALNTGCLRARDGTVLSRAKGKAFVDNPSWRERLDVIVDLLRAVRSRYDSAVQEGLIRVTYSTYDREYYVIRDSSIADWMDQTRAQILAIFTSICKEAGLPGFTFPRFPRRRY